MSAYADRVIADGATYYWRLDDPSGTVATATVGGANGTIAAGVTLNQPPAILDGHSMLFDGVTGRITTGAAVSIPATLTLEAWIKGAAVPSFQAIVSTRNGTASIGTFFGVNTNVLTIIDTSANSASGVRVVRDGQWHQVVVVVTAGATAAFYVDGALDTSAAFPHTVPEVSVVAVLAADTPGGLPWAGSLDEVAIYPTALSAATIGAHYTLGTTAAGNTHPWWVYV